MRAGWIGNRNVRDSFRDQLGMVPAIVVHHGIGVVVGPAAGGVSKKMVDRDIGDVLLVRWLAVL